MDRRIQEDGTVIVSGQVVPTGGAQPTIASVVSYSGNTGLQSTNVEGALDELDNEKAPLTHTHDDRYFTEVEVTNLLASKAATNHTHDDRYYTESEIDAKIVVLNNSIAGKAATNHTHDDRYYTEAEVNQRIAEALGSLDAHQNPSFDLVEMSTDGPGGDVVASRVYPTGWGNFWGNGSASTRPIISADPNVTRLGVGYSLKIELPGVDSGQAMTSSVFAVTPGSVVSIEGWIKGTGATNGPYGLMTLYTNKDIDPDFFQPGTAGIDTPLLKPGSGWTRMGTSLTVPAGHNRCRLMVRGYANEGGLGAGPGTIWWDDTKSKVQVFPPSGVVTGEIKMWPSASAPEGYLLCNGGTFSSVDYPALAALLGDTFGTHSGTTYYLPDFRGRSPIGVGSVVPAAGGENYSLGLKWGDSRIPSHTHSGSTGDDSPDHTHPVARWSTGAYPGGASDGSVHFGANATHLNYAGTSGASNRHQHSFVTADHNSPKQSSGMGNIHPVLAVNYIIKAA